MCITRTLRIENAHFRDEPENRNIFIVNVELGSQTLITNIQNEMEQLAALQNALDGLIGDQIEGILDQEEENDNFLIIFSAFVAAILSFPIVYAQIWLFFTLFDSLLDNG